MCSHDNVRVGVGSCGKPYAPNEERCQEKVLVGADGKPNGLSRCPQRIWCIGEAGKV